MNVVGLSKVVMLLGVSPCAGEDKWQKSVRLHTSCKHRKQNMQVISVTHASTDKNKQHKINIALRKLLSKKPMAFSLKCTSLRLEF